MLYLQDGIESVRQLRQWEETCSDHLKQHVIGASACSREETRNEALGVGMDEFMLKPLDISDLIEGLNGLHCPLDHIV